MKKKPATTKTPSRTVRPHPEAFALLHNLKGAIAQRGWGAVGLKRTDAPTLGAVMGAALTVLAQRLRAGRA